jgi:hypothetical protein
MSMLYSIEAPFSVQHLASQQEELYQTQLQAIAALTLRGVGANIGIGSSVSQNYIDISTGASEFTTSLIWQNPRETNTNIFAVLPQKATARKYFGSVSQPDPNGNRFMVEGVNIHATGSNYGHMLIRYNEDIDPDQQVSFATLAFVRQMQAYQYNDSKDPNTAKIALRPSAHQRLGGALLSFWDTLSLPPSLEVQQSANKNAFELSRQIINHGVEQSFNEHPNSPFDAVRAYRDTRGNIAGFVGHSLATNSVTIVVRNHLTFPERIDYIQIPFTNGAEIPVSHHAITPYTLSSRYCIIEAEKVVGDRVNDLVLAIQTNQRPLEVQDSESVDDIVRELHTQLGGFFEKEAPRLPHE